MLGLHSPQQPRQHKRRDRGENPEGDHASDRGQPGAPSDAQHHDHDQGCAHADQVLDEAPSQENLVGAPVGGPAAAASDVDDDDTRRHRDREADHGGACRRNPERKTHPRAEYPRQQNLDRRQQEKAAALAGEAQRVDFDADLEEEKHDADVSEDRELISVGDVSGRERRNEDPDQ